MKSNKNYFEKMRDELDNVKPEKEKEIFLSQETREKLINTLLHSQEKLTYYHNNRKLFPDRDLKNFLMDQEEEKIYKIKTILINNKF